MRDLIPADWRPHLGDSIRSDHFARLEDFLLGEWQKATVYPPREDVFAAFHLTPYHRVKAVILGQDPYHGPGQAHGLCFSVPPGAKNPPSLRNILRELHHDLGIPVPNGGCLTPWAEQGVLLLNTVLTVRAGNANSHRNRGWEMFTDAVIAAINRRTEPVAFVLWGRHAEAKARLIDTARHPVVRSPHPSPLSARRGFFGSRPFSKVNAALRQSGQQPVDWSLADMPLFAQSAVNAQHSERTQ